MRWFVCLQMRILGLSKGLNVKITIKQSCCNKGKPKGVESRLTTFRGKCDLESNFAL